MVQRFLTSLSGKQLIDFSGGTVISSILRYCFARREDLEECEEF